MSRTIGVPLPHQSHFRLWAPIDQLPLWPQAVQTYEIPPLSPRIWGAGAEPWEGLPRWVDVLCVNAASRR
ncbi:hypothetical protein GCM10010389_06580 [Streptomyces echinoruber]|uniref:Uncharacterized protein n=1 Tax=Streptomyces echinoruber TaxID=68898 RepID=A0A918QVT0_9ACTN|nr:hypothetical protein GCM10010389_06580 [Streptomyces echinoruber]